MNTPGDVLLWAASGAATGAALTPITQQLAHRPQNLGLLLPVASALTATLFGLLAWRTPALPDLLGLSAFAALAVPLAILDIAEQRLPLPLIHSAYVAAVTVLAVSSTMNGDISTALRAAAGMTVALAVFLAIGLAYPRDLGAGDVRLSGVIGWVLAWKSWTALALGAMVFALATLAALISMRTRQHKQTPGGHQCCSARW